MKGTAAMRALWHGVAFCSLLPCTVASGDFQKGTVAMGSTQSGWLSRRTAEEVVKHAKVSIDAHDIYRRTTESERDNIASVAPGYFDDVRASSHCAKAVLRVQLQEGDEPKTFCLGSENEGITGEGHPIFDDDVFQLRHFGFFMPLTGHDRAPIAFDSTAAAALALHHFNNGNGTVIPELAQLSKTCPVRYTMEIFDTKFEGIPTTTAKHVQQDIFPRFKSTHSVFEHNYPPAKPIPSLLMGSFRGEVTSILSLLGGVKHIPTLSYGSAAEALDNREIYPTLARTITSSAVDGIVLADYFASILKVKYVAILYTLQADGIGIARAFQDAAEKYDIKVVSSGINPDSVSREEIEDALRPLADSKFKYFFGAFFHPQVPFIMPVALEMGLAGADTFWLFATMGPLPQVALKGNESLVEAMNNTASLGFAPTTTLLADTKAEGCAQSPHTTSSVSRFRALAWVWSHLGNDDAFLSYFRGLLPAHLQQSPLFAAGFPFFSIPLSVGSLVYDAVITLLFASCRAAGADNIVFNTTTLYDSLFELDFDGTYGRMLLDRERGSRKRGTLPYTLTNYRANLNVTDGMVTFEDVFTHMYTSCDEGKSKSEPGWYKIVGAPDFRYADGTTTQPEQLSPAAAEYILLTSTALCFGYTMSGLVMASSLALIAWVVWNRKTRVIILSQPSFLIMLCVGTTLMGSAIVPFGFQEPMSQKTVDRACMAAPWLFCIGFVTAFSALLSRLSRVNKIFHASYARRRRAREHRDTAAGARIIMLPFFVLLSLNLVVLLVWTLMAPLEYKFEPLDVEDEFGRTIEYYGTCYPPNLKDDPLTLTFALLLLGINALALIGANVEAYRARSINEFFSDSRLVGESTMFILQASLVGIPIPFLSVLARYIVVSCLIPAICLAVLAPLFSYKIALLRRVVDDESNAPSSAHSSSRDTLLSLGWTPNLRRRPMQGGGSTITMNTTAAEDDFASR